MLGSALQRLARSAVSAARLSNWSFGRSAPSPGGLPVWHSTADSVYGSQGWQHALHSLAPARPVTLDSAKALQQQPTALCRPSDYPSTAVRIQQCMQRQRLQSGMATSTATPQASITAARQLPDHAPKPWTPTDQLQKRKILPKRMGHMLAVRRRCCVRTHSPQGFGTKHTG